MDIVLPEYIDGFVRERLHEVMATVSMNLPEKPVEAFVSTSRGEPNYLGVWLFTEKLAVEIRNPLNRARIQYDMFRFSDAVDWIRLNARNYEFTDPVEDSELELEFSTIDGVSGILSANGAGCHYLMEVYKSRFLQNFIVPPVDTDQC